MAELGRSWLDAKPLDAAALAGLDTPANVERAAGLLARSFPAAGPLVLKDPRLSRLLPFWRRVFEETGIAPAVVIAVRAPSAVARSLQRRDQLPLAHGEALWNAYVLDAESGSRGLRRAVVHYEDLGRNPCPVLLRLLSDLGLAAAANEALWQAAAASLRPAPAAAAEPAETPSLAGQIHALSRMTGALAGTGAWDDLRRTWAEDWQQREPGTGASIMALARPETHLLAAQHRLRQKRPEQAVAAAREAVRLIDRLGLKLAHLFLALATVFEAAGMPGEALAQAEQAAAVQPGASTLCRVGHYQTLLGNMAEAERAYRQAIELDPGFALAGILLAHLLFKQDRFAEALPLALQAASARHDAGDYHLAARCQERLGDLAGALATLDHAIALHPGEPALPALRRRLERLQRNVSG